MEFSERDDFVHNLLYAYFRRAGLMVLVFALLFASVFFMAWLLTPTWKSKVYLALDPSGAQPVARFADPTRFKPERMEAAYAYQVVQMLEGKEIALRVVQAFGLDEKLRQKTEDPQTSRERIHATVSSFVTSIVDVVKFVFRIESRDTDTDWTDKAAREFHDGLFAWVAAKPVTDTDIVELEVSAPSADLANEIVDFMINELREQLIRQPADGGRKAVAAFDKQLSETRAYERQAESALQQFIEEHGGIDPAESAQLKTIERDGLQSRRERLLAEQSELERQNLDNAVDGLPALSERMLQSDTVKQMRANLLDLRVKRAALVVELTEAHPDVVEADALIREIGAAIRSEFEAARGTIAVELRQVEDHLAQLDAELKELSRRQLYVSRLQSDVSDWQTLRREIQAHVDGIRVSTVSGIGPLTVRVLDRVRVSTAKSPDVPSWMIVAVLAFVFASGGAILVPPFIEYWRDPIRGPVDLARKDVPTLAVIPPDQWGRCARWWRRVRGKAEVQPELEQGRWHDLAAMLTLESREGGGRWCVVLTEVHGREAGSDICRRVAEQASRMGRRVVVLSVHSPESRDGLSLANADRPLDHAWDGARGCLFVSLPAFFGDLPSCGTKPAEWVTDFDLMLVDAPAAGTQIQSYLAARSNAVILIADSRRQPLSEVVRLSESMVASGTRLLGAVLLGHSSPLPAWLDRWHDRPD